MKLHPWLLGFALLITACDDGGGGTGGTGGAGGEGATAGAGGSTGGSTTGGGGTGTTSSTTTTTGNCSADTACTKQGDSCVYQMDSCDPSATGLCDTVTCDGSEPNHGPICLCDGEVFEGNAECLVWSQGKAIAKPEVCAKGTFPCGMVTCTQNTQFCLVTYAGPQGSTPSYECRDIASAEGTCDYGISDCGCLDLDALGCPDSSCCLTDGFWQETVTLFLP
ncbi:MAG: hypothetical protein R3B70_05255 [Polyangiaceae bacterium]